MLWVVIGAVLVIFMQAGFALVETGFCRAKHAAHVVSTNFAIFGLGFIGFFFIGFPLALERVRHDAVLRRVRASPVGSALLGSGNWVFLWKGGWAHLRRRHRRRRARLLPLHGRLHGHRRDDPDGRHGRALEVGQLRHLGPVLRRHLLPAVRGVDVGRRLALQDVGHDEPRRRLRRLRRQRGGPRRRRRRRARRRHGARTPHRQVRRRTASRGPSPATTSRWPCSARSSCCSGGSASTPPRRSPPPTCSSPPWPRTRRSPARSAPSSPCCGSPAGPASPTPA